jgi:OOP family OmpA-OmpF porin
MKLKTNIKERGVLEVTIFFLFLLTGMYSCVVQAQPLVPAHHEHSFDHPVVQAKYVNKDINHAAEVDHEAEAVALSAFVNSPFEDLKPALTPSGDRLYFSRHIHPDNTNGADDLEDIWYSEFDKTTEKWSHPIRMAGVLNNAGPNFINNVSVTGDTIILGNQYLKKGKMRAGLSYSVNVNGQWSVPTNISIKNDYNISNQANAYVSLRDGVIITAIQRVETVGGRDLYVSFWDGKEATEPINMGSIINTDLEESSPFLAADNKTLYFASKGHHGHGGFDIFRTKRLDETWTNWSEPENLGPAVNGALDDEFFSITHDGEFATFSKQVNVHNVDLYRISTQELFKHEKMHAHNSAFASL